MYPVKKWASTDTKPYRFALPSTQKNNIVELSVLLRLTVPDVIRTAINLLYEEIKHSDEEE